MDFEENYFEEGLDEEDLFESYGEGFEDEFDAVQEKVYEKAFAKADDQAHEFLENEDDLDENDYEFDSIVGGRDKKPIMSMLNKGKLSKYEMDDLLNQL